ncbi:MAG: hypothetical protein QOD68_2205 [Actinomycetota bacterium]|nr:hypothetical protein [Actinomycetota bacterium]
MTDPRLAPVPVVARFAGSLGAVVDLVAFYAGGSLGTGDYRPGVSDLDLAAVVGSAPDPAAEAALTRLHQDLAEADDTAAKLHCFYLPRDRLTDPAEEQLNWAHRELYRRPFTVVARAELLRHGITVLGPEAASLFAPVDAAELRDAARSELTGFWAGAVRKPHLWLQDVYVDLGLLTVARVEATVTEDRLITKQEALTRLDRFEVPGWLVDQIGRRRAGDSVTLTAADQARRAVVARRIVAQAIGTLGTAGR